MESIIRRGDAIVRYGGDECIIYLQEVSLNRASEVVVLVQKIVKENSTYVDISSGFRPFVKDTNDTIRVADDYMYQMKESK